MRFYNSFDYIESYKFSFGKYRGKSLDEIKENEDSLEFLKWYRKKIKKELRNPKAKKFEVYNKRGLKEVETYLISIGEDIDLTNLDEDIEEVVEEVVDYSKLTFKELLALFEEKIIKNYDIKFQQSKFIRKEYKDYLCLRYTNLTYMELLEKNSEQDLITVLEKI